MEDSQLSEFIEHFLATIFEIQQGNVGRTFNVDAMVFARIVKQLPDNQVARRFTVVNTSSDCICYEFLNAINLAVRKHFLMSVPWTQRRHAIRLSVQRCSELAKSRPEGMLELAREYLQLCEQAPPRPKILHLV